MEKDFIDALERLRNRQPQHPDLAKKAKLGTLQINVTTVAQEAGRSRTLIGMDDCRYPRVRAAILAEKADVASVVETRTAEDVIRRLRDDRAALAASLRASESENAALLLRLRDVERAAQREIGIAERRATNGQGGRARTGLNTGASQVIPLR
ncbi:hypothetical protein [Azospirillum palustre]|uniref:hypothetical protein n=1 Tax=Azospirillum palustre TaxID=2044885 RepID=UPI0011773F8B|nr:hypothetical protein [Azospirillum palustre]